jgi:hypothetical protein
MSCFSSFGQPQEKTDNIYDDHSYSKVSYQVAYSNVCALSLERFAVHWRGDRRGPCGV